MKRLLIGTDLVFFLSSCLVASFLFFVTPVRSNQPDLMVIGVFLGGLFISIASGTTLLLYSPHLILKRMNYRGLTRKFLWKEAYITSLRRGILLAATVVGLLLINLFEQGGMVNTIILVTIFVLIEGFFIQK